MIGKQLLVDLFNTFAVNKSTSKLFPPSNYQSIIAFFGYCYNTIGYCNNCCIFQPVFGYRASKCWSKYSFLRCLNEKNKIKRKKQENWSKMRQKRYNTKTSPSHTTNAEQHTAPKSPCRAQLAHQPPCTYHPPKPPPHMNSHTSYCWLRVFFPNFFLIVVNQKFMEKIEHWSASCINKFKKMGVWFFKFNFFVDFGLLFST